MTAPTKTGWTREHIAFAQGLAAQGRTPTQIARALDEIGRPTHPRTVGQMLDRQKRPGAIDRIGVVPLTAGENAIIREGVLAGWPASEIARRIKADLSIDRSANTLSASKAWRVARAEVRAKAAAAMPARAEPAEPPPYVPPSVIGGYPTTQWRMHRDAQPVTLVRIPSLEARA